MEAAMRSEEEMMHLILQVAKDDERVRAVYLNGSRTNPNAPKDRFQDYDPLRPKIHDYDDNFCCSRANQQF